MKGLNRYRFDMFLSGVTLTALTVSTLPGSVLAQDASPKVKPAAKSASTSAKAPVSNAKAASSTKPGSSNVSAAKPKTSAGATTATADADGKDADAKDAVTPAATLISPGLTAAIQAYRGAPSEATWGGVWRELGALLLNPAAVKAPTASILSQNPPLGELSPKIVDAEGGRVWSFPRQPESQGVFLQWQGSVVKSVETVGRRGRKVVRAVAVPVSKAQAFSIPSGVTISDAHLLRGAAPAPAPKVVAGKNAAGKKVVHSAPAPAPLGKFLVFSGLKKATGTVWLQAYKLSGDSWVESPELFSGLPPFLTDNVAGRASFSGNDIALDFCGKGDKTGDEASASKVPAVSSGYRIVLHFANGKYVLAGQDSDDAPMMTALQFTQAIQQGRADLAKAWLVDPKLINIPKYIGIIGKNGGLPFKLIAMANPNNGISRFRVITFEKDDLIIDVGRVKNQMAIKGLFIASPDPLAQRLLGNLPSADKMSDKSGDPKPSTAPADKN